MNKRQMMVVFCIAAFYFAAPGGIHTYADTGVGRVYALDPISTPEPEYVDLEDLDDSGYLRNEYLKLVVLKDSPYDHRPYSAVGEYIYEPVEWNNAHVSPEGVRFDFVSNYYYYTMARKYFEEKFGFQQSWDGVHPEQLTVIMFNDGQREGGCFPHLREIVNDVPVEDEWPDFYVNPNHTFSVAMHEYTHLVYMRYLKRLAIHNNEAAIAINEGFAVFWPSAIVESPLYNRALWPPGHERLIDLGEDVIYDPDNPNYDYRGRNGNMILSVATSLWSLLEHPRIGKTNAEAIIFEAMKLVDPGMLGNLTAACVDAKHVLPEGVGEYLDDAYIAGVFVKNNIPLTRDGSTTYLSVVEQSNDIPATMQAGEVQNVTLVFKNISPHATWDMPVLNNANPAVNPNVDAEQEVNTSYAWGLSAPVYPQVQGPLPPQAKVVFNFDIVAPDLPGVYACDWEVDYHGQGTFKVTADIVVTGNLQPIGIAFPPPWILFSSGVESGGWGGIGSVP